LVVNKTSLTHASSLVLGFQGERLGIPKHSRKSEWPQSPNATPLSALQLRKIQECGMFYKQAGVWNLPNINKQAFSILSISKNNKIPNFLIMNPADARAME
jgi:hypothetical protein